MFWYYPHYQAIESMRSYITFCPFRLSALPTPSFRSLTRSTLAISPFCFSALFLFSTILPYSQAKIVFHGIHSLSYSILVHSYHDRADEELGEFSTFEFSATYGCKALLNLSNSAYLIQSFGIIYLSAQLMQCFGTILPHSLVDHDFKGNSYLGCIVHSSFSLVIAEYSKHLRHFDAKLQLSGSPVYLNILSFSLVDTEFPSFPLFDAALYPFVYDRVLADIIAFLIKVLHCMVTF